MFPLIRGIPPDLSVFSLCLSCLLSPLPLEKTVVQEYSAFAWRIETCDLDNGHLSCQIFFYSAQTQVFRCVCISTSSLVTQSVGKSPAFSLLDI